MEREEREGEMKRRQRRQRMEREKKGRKVPREKPSETESRLIVKEIQNGGRLYRKGKRGQKGIDREEEEAYQWT